MVRDGKSQRNMRIDRVVRSGMERGWLVMVRDDRES